MSDKKSIFNHPEFEQYRDRWNTRLNELNRRSSYYEGTAYLKGVDSRLFYKTVPQLIGEIKPLYLFLSRAVEVDAGIVPGGWLFPEEAPTEWTTARDLIFGWSRWTTEGVLYVDYGSRYGLVGLRIADVPGERVFPQPVDPTTFLLISPNQYDETVETALFIEQRTDESGEPFEYCEVITPELFRTFKDGEPFGFDGRDPETVNETGVVPFIEVQNKRTGNPLSECTFERQIPVLDQVNELATQLAGVLRENQDPQVVVIGAEPGDLTRGKDYVWFLPLGGDVKMIVPNVNVEGTLKFIQDVKEELKQSLPELSFDALKDASQIATETLETKLTELVLKIKRVRPNYDDGLVRAFRLAAKIADVQGVDGLEVFLENNDLVFDEDRAVLPMDPATLLDLEIKQMERDSIEAITRAGYNQNNDEEV